jgi:ATP-dependent helicase/nuclease subunit A
VVVTVSQAKLERAGAQPPADVAVESTDADRARRPHGKRFGILVHAVLASVALDASDLVVAVAARAQGRLVGATAEEVDAAATAATLALAHPLLRRAARALECRRESPVLCRRPDGSLLEGVLDLAFREREGDGEVWTVVDFKSDVEISGRRADYQRQVTLYADAVAQAAGVPARGVLFVV